MPRGLPYRTTSDVIVVVVFVVVRVVFFLDDVAATADAGWHVLTDADVSTPFAAYFDDVMPPLADVSTPLTACFADAAFFDDVAFLAFLAGVEIATSVVLEASNWSSRNGSDRSSSGTVTEETEAASHRNPDEESNGTAAMESSQRTWAGRNPLEGGNPWEGNPWGGWRDERRGGGGGGGKWVDDGTEELTWEGSP